nr:MAG TPA: hypothetical protein [Bacteriophage sp.]
MVLSFHGLSGEVFFSFHIGLHIQSPEFDQLRKHLINGKGVESIQPLFRCVRNACICMFCHDKCDILKHLQRKHVQIGTFLTVVSNGFLQCFQVLINIPLELHAVNSRNGSRCLKGHLLTVNLNLLNHAHYATPPSSSSVVTGIYTDLYQSL